MAVSVTDADTFKAFLKERAREVWDERRSPYYLSFVATELKKQGADYRDLIAPLKLSQWAASNDIPETTLVVHPTQRARIGLVPQDSGFEFTIAEAVAESDAKSETGSRGRALVRFVQSLANLPEDAVADMAVPAKTLIAFLRQ